MTVSAARRSPSSPMTEGPDATATPTPTATVHTHAARGAQRATTHAAQPDVFEGHSAPAIGQRVTRPMGDNAAVCAPREPDEAVATRFRAMLASGSTPHIAPAPPLPHRDGATVLRELNAPRATLSAGEQRLASADLAPITGYVMPRLMHALEGAAGVHTSSVAHAGIELALHGLVEGAGHMLQHAGAHALTARGASLWGPVGATLVSYALLTDALVGSVIETACRLNNGTLPPSHAVQQFIRDHSAEILAQTQSRMEAHAERQFSAGVQAGARGEPLARGSNPAEAAGYRAGIAYRREHGCAFDTSMQQLRVLQDVTRGTDRDARVGVRPLSAQPERPAGVTTEREMRGWLEGL
ncbi:MAG: hypothetical protein Q8Q09_09705 [Deltaproteobacteria bacterium]|nr:hypothetical protein [Deltaproteobacteria bacterium]